MYFLIFIVVFILIYVKSFKESFSQEKIQKVAPVLLVCSLCVFILAILISIVRA